MITLTPQPRRRGSFRETVNSFRREPLTARGIETLQVNMGYRCNLSCSHCHVEAGPGRPEIMDSDTIDAVLRALSGSPIATVDITGGAPELHPGLRGFLRALRAAGHAAQVRTNLTALLEPECEGLPSFLAEHGVRLVASLPCYLEENVDSQRGPGVYRRSIEALRRLNAAGYGGRPELPLDLVYNPGGASLPPGQCGLEGDTGDASPAEVGYFTDLFQANGLVLLAGPEGDRLVPARSLDRISLQGLFHCVLGGSALAAHPSRPAMALYDYAAIRAAGESLADRTVLDYIKSGEKP